MRKKFLSFVLCFSLIVCSLFFVSGCKQKDYSKEDVSTLYTSMKSGDNTKQFFENDKIKITFNDIDMSESDPGYIFELVYDYYLQSASGFLTSILNRVGSITYAIKDFNQSQITDFYNKLYQVKTKLEDFYVSKTIFESSEGKLHYKTIIADYNGLLSALYSLNNTYSNYYFSTVGKVNFTTDELTNGNIRDFLWKQLLSLSNVSFKHELVNFVPSNPIGEVKNSWYENTEYLKNYVNLCKRALMVLNSSGDLSLLLGSNSDNAKSIFARFQSQEKSYLLELGIFNNNLSSFNFKQYFSSQYKNAYLQNCSLKEKSAYNIIYNFLDGQYLARTNAMNLINNYLGV